MSINSKTKAAVDTLLTDNATTEAQFQTGLQDVTTEVDTLNQNVLRSSDLGSTVQAYDVDTAKLDVAQNWTAKQSMKLPDASGCYFNVGYSTSSINDPITNGSMSNGDLYINYFDAGIPPRLSYRVNDTNYYAQVYDADLQEISGLGLPGSSSFLVKDSVGGYSLDATTNYLQSSALGVTVQAYDADTAKLDVAQTYTAAQKFLTIRETYASYTPTGTTQTVDTSTGTVFTLDLGSATGDVTLTFSNPPTTGTAYGMTIKVIQGATARAITWPASVDWPSATAPTITTTNDGVDVFTFYTHDGGTTWYGFTAGQALA